MRYSIVVSRGGRYVEAREIEKAITFIDGNLKSEYSLADVASHVGYSAYHFSREFRLQTGMPVMAYVRNRKLQAAAREIAGGRSILDVALDYGFETHGGFTKAFISTFGCGPRQYQAHENKPFSMTREGIDMEKIVVRPICETDVNDLWENVYSAMTPKEILNEKILPSMAGYGRKEIIHLVAEADGTVVGTLLLWRFNDFHPFGHLFDECVNPGYPFKEIMSRLLEGMKERAKAFGVNTIEYYTYEDSPTSGIFQELGFTRVFNSGGCNYHMMAI